MKTTTTTASENALLRKNGEFIVKDQIIFQYPKAITTQQVKAQVHYLLGRKAVNANVEVKLLDRNKHIFHIAGPGVHSWGDEVMYKLGTLKPVPPIPPPIIPNSILKNTLHLQQKGLKNMLHFKTDTFKLK